MTADAKRPTAQFPLSSRVGSGWGSAQSAQPAEVLTVEAQDFFRPTKEPAPERCRHHHRHLQKEARAVETARSPTRLTKP